MVENEEALESEGRDVRVREKEIRTYKRSRRLAELETGHKGVHVCVYVTLCVCVCMYMSACVLSGFLRVDAAAPYSEAKRAGGKKGN